MFLHFHKVHHVQARFPYSCNHPTFQLYLVVVVVSWIPEWHNHIWNKLSCMLITMQQTVNVEGQTDIFKVTETTLSVTSSKPSIRPFPRTSPTTSNSSRNISIFESKYVPTTWLLFCVPSSSIAWSDKTAGGVITKFMSWLFITSQVIMSQES